MLSVKRDTNFYVVAYLRTRVLNVVVSHNEASSLVPIICFCWRAHTAGSVLCSHHIGASNCLEILNLRPLSY